MTTKQLEERMRLVYHGTTEIDVYMNYRGKQLAFVEKYPNYEFRRLLAHKYDGVKPNERLLGLTYGQALRNLWNTGVELREFYSYE